MKKYSHDNWNQILALPDGPHKGRQLKTVGSLAKGNLHWFVRRLLGKKDDPAYRYATQEMMRRSIFLDYMERLDEEV